MLPLCIFHYYISPFMMKITSENNEETLRKSCDTEIFKILCLIVMKKILRGCSTNSFFSLLQHLSIFSVLCYEHLVFKFINLTL